MPIRVDEPDFVPVTQAERDAFNRYLWLKAFLLNVKQGAIPSGIFGAALGGFIGMVGNVLTGAYIWAKEEPEDTAIKFASVGYAITAVPGKLIGAVTSPIRRFSMFPRELRYSHKQVDAFVSCLKQAVKDCSTDQKKLSDAQFSATFEPIVKDILSSYSARPILGSSASSDVLIYHLNGTTKFVSVRDRDDFVMGHEVCSYGSAAPNVVSRVKHIADYLSATEVLGSDATRYRKNQGKKLFNVVMDVLKKHEEALCALAQNAAEPSSSVISASC
ncbi:MAG: hypothetical protein Q8R79_06020 [Legionellaceae bacterium]|nr:hypothetical protein [Legionellaceae bacterium]